jgi:hypothetical protein
MEFFEPRVAELLTQIAAEYSLAFDELLSKYSTKTKAKVKTPSKKKKKAKKTQPVHNHKPGETPKDPCALCMSHGDVLTVVPTMKFVIAQ